MAAMNLTGLQNRRAADLSAGQKRRLGLARLLVTGRAVWLLDEPTVSLDTASVGLFGAMSARASGAGRGGADCHAYRSGPDRGARPGPDAVPAPCQRARWRL